jgi:hypothetical protein
VGDRDDIIEEGPTLWEIEAQKLAARHKDPELDGIDTDKPSQDLPGSEEKLRLLAARYREGKPLWNNDDRIYPDDSEDTPPEIVEPVKEFHKTEPLPVPKPKPPRKRRTPKQKQAKPKSFKPEDFGKLFEEEERQVKKEKKEFSPDDFGDLF